MKHAYLILAHGEFENELINLVQMIDFKDNDIYIHLDIRSSINPMNIISSVKKSNCKFIDRKRVSWGGFSIIDAEMRLFKNACANGQYRYFHILSGLDLPVQSQEYIHEYMEQHDGEEFLQLIHFPDSEHPEMRYSQYHLLQDSLIGKKRNIWKYLDFSSCYLQKYIGICRFKNTTMQAASQWMSITNDCLQYILEHSEYILQQFRWTYCCDEYFIPTILYHSEFFSHISHKGNLRYINFVWYSKHDLSPKVLTTSDIKDLSHPDVLFARKFILPESNLLIKQIKDRINNV